MRIGEVYEKRTLQFTSLFFSNPVLCACKIEVAFGAI
jgi:hypothetical protein